MKSELWKLRQNLQHPRIRLPSAGALYRIVRLNRLNETGGEEDPAPSKCQRIGRKIADVFRFFFFVPKGKLFVHEVIFSCSSIIT